MEDSATLNAEHHNILSVARKSSDNEKAEGTFRDREESGRLFELPLIGIATTSPSKGWMEVNDKLCEILGYSREELTRLTWAELTHSDDARLSVYCAQAFG